MKRLFVILGGSALCLGLTGCATRFQGPNVFTWLLGIFAVLLLAFGILRARSIAQYNKRRRRKPLSKDQYTMTAIVFVAAAIFFVGTFLTLFGAAPQEETPHTSEASTQATTLETGEASQPSDSEPLETTTAPPALSFTPGPTPDTDPANWGIDWDIYVDSAQVDSYFREEPIFFGEPESYFEFPGIATFRGNNYRNAPSYGTATVEQETLTLSWDAETSTLPGATWSGSGWTGQPLIVRWDEYTREIMNLYPEKRDKAELVEVIYATLDGNIYFLDLEDGTPTRDPINVGLCFKGAGSLDPRGWPLMYVGSGDVNPEGERPRMYIISLIDGSILFEYGHEELISNRTDNNNWCAFDSAPLVSAATDTLIWPGESGILYTMKLNTVYYDGTISVSPDNMVKTVYTTSRSSSEKYWYGYEASVDIVENYLYVSENGGMFFCIDLNTMELVWAQDTKDDSNCSPVFEKTEDGGYIYTAPSLHWTRDENMEGTIGLYKLDALTGEVLWRTDYPVHTVDGVSGGVQSTPLLGKPGTKLEGLVIYTVARTPEEYSGLLVALDTQTGEEVWRMDMNNYAWSSPVGIYEDDGNGYIVVCDSMGYIMLVSHRGELLYTESLGGLVEASPAVFENTLVVGTRAEKICGITIS